MMNMTTDVKIKEALMTQLEKEKAMESYLAEQEQEWKKEWHKAQLEIDSLISHLTQTINKIQEAD